MKGVIPCLTFFHSYITLDLIQILSMAYEALLNPGLDSLLNFHLVPSIAHYFPDITASYCPSHTSVCSSFMEFALVLSIAEMPFAYLLGEILLDRFKCLLLWEILRPPIPKQSRDTQWPCPALKTFLNCFPMGSLFLPPQENVNSMRSRLQLSYIGCTRVPGENWHGLFVEWIPKWIN